MLLGTQRVNERGRLEIGGCDAVELARGFGTPLYVLDEALIRRNCREYRAAFEKRYPKVKLYFAGKALLCTAVCGIIAQEGVGLDVASGGELFTALKAGFPTDRIALHGNNKSVEELELAIESGVGRVVVDNLPEIELLQSLADRAGRTVEVSLRATPGIDPHTHRRIRTGQEDSKFGLNIANGSAMEGIRRIVRQSRLRLRGVHCHIGSQLLDAEAHRSAAPVMAGFFADARREGGEDVDELNIGGGLGIRYLPEHRPPTLDEFSQVVTETLWSALEEHGLREAPPVLAQEPGRFLVGEAGTTLYTVGVVKQIPGVRTYVSIDGGMSDNPRPQLYDAKYTALIADRAGETPTGPYTVAGKHCETDILIWDTPLSDPRHGDILAVLSTGAYNFSMASNYNRFRRPPVVLVNDGRADLVVRRETWEEIVARDIQPERLACRPAEAVAAAA